MFTISYHERMPIGAFEVSSLVGGNYHYDAAFYEKDCLYDILFHLKMPIPVGPPVREPIPVRMQGLIRSTPYVDPDQGLIKAGELTQFVPVWGHMEGFDTSELQDARFLPDEGVQNFVEGEAEYLYRWTEQRTKTISGTARWKYHGKWYSREWSKDVNYEVPKSATIRYYDSVRLMPRTAKRHLNLCDHSKIDGELWLASASLGFTATRIHPLRFRTLAPLLVKEAKILANEMFPQPAYDLPSDRTVWRGGSATVLPRLYRVFRGDRLTTEVPSEDYLAHCMCGLTYMGTRYHSSTYGSGVGHVYGYVGYPKLEVSDKHPPKLYGDVSFWHWIDDPSKTFRFILWRTPNIRVELPMSHNEEEYIGLLRQVWSDQGTSLSWSRATFARQLTFAENPRYEIAQKALLESAYSRLWSAVLPRNMDDVYRQTVGHAAQDALLGTKVLNINSIMYLKDFTTLRELCNSFTDLLTKGLSPKTISGAYLAQHYGVSLTALDTQEIIERARHEALHMHDDYQYSYGRAFSTVMGPCGRIDVMGNCSVLFSLIDNGAKRFLSQLARWDLVPTPRVIWDMIPYSFVADWILPIGDVLEHWDALLTRGTINQKRCCWSHKTVCELDPGLLAPALLKFDTQILASSGTLKLVGYRRHYQRFAPSPSALLDLLDISPSWSSSRLYEIASLTIQRLS